MNRLLDRALNGMTVLALGVICYAGFRQGGFVRTTWAEHRRSARLESLRITLWDSLAAGASRFGPQSGPIAVVEFADYECPFCRQVSAGVDSVLASSNESAVFRNFPIPGHKLARGAALAAICATDQGRFREIHTRLMATEVWRSDSNWAREAAAAGVPDPKAFSMCLTSARATGILARDIELARRLEVPGTPTFITSRRQWSGGVFSSDSLN